MTIDQIAKQIQHSAGIEIHDAYAALETHVTILSTRLRCTGRTDLHEATAIIETIVDEIMEDAIFADC